MARYLDEEAEKEFIDISSTSDSHEQGAAGRAPGGGALPAPPHQPAVEVSMAPSNQENHLISDYSSVTSFNLLPPLYRFVWISRLTMPPSSNTSTSFLAYASTLRICGLVPSVSTSTTRSHTFHGVLLKATVIESRVLVPFSGDDQSSLGPYSFLLCTAECPSACAHVGEAGWSSRQARPSERCQTTVNGALWGRHGDESRGSAAERDSQHDHWYVGYSFHNRSHGDVASLRPCLLQITPSLHSNGSLARIARRSSAACAGWRANTTATSDSIRHRHRLVVETFQISCA